MRVLFSAGGTGGHINPALAMADIIKANIPTAEIAFVGSEKGIESSLIPQAGYRLYSVKSQGIKRSLSPSNIKALYLALTSPSKAKKIIKDFAPDVVIGTGGYACWPALRAAVGLGIPTMLHESNAIPGMAVRRLKNDVDVIMTNFDSTAEQLGSKRRVVSVGNPLRAACSTLTKEQARKKLGIGEEVVILSFGGSLGAQSINRIAAKMMSGFGRDKKDVRCYHVGGKRYYENARKYFSACGLERDARFSLMEYTNELPTYMAAADIVICRGGAMTITEISRMGKAAIIIPSPNVVEDHQYKNAKVLADADAAIVVREDPEGWEDERKVCEAVKMLYADKERRERMAKNIKAFAKDDVERVIYEEIMSLVGKL